LLIAYPWIILTAGTLAYLISLPFGWLSHRAYERRSGETKAEPIAASPMPSAPLAPTIVGPAGDDERPSRLN